MNNVHMALTFTLEFVNGLILDKVTSHTGEQMLPPDILAANYGDILKLETREFNSGELVINHRLTYKGAMTIVDKLEDEVIRKAVHTEVAFYYRRNSPEYTNTIIELEFHNLIVDNNNTRDTDSSTWVVPVQELHQCIDNAIGYYNGTPLSFTRLIRSLKLINTYRGGYPSYSEKQLDLHCVRINGIPKEVASLDLMMLVLSYIDVELTKGVTTVLNELGHDYYIDELIPSATID